jgi:death on curing protein
LPNEPRWLSLETVIEINRALVAATGEHHFLRDQGLLEGALARPQNAFAYGEEDIVALGVRLMAGIAQSHAFEQGNKRTAFTSMRLFFRANSYDMGFEDSEEWADKMVELIEHHLSEEDFVAALRPFVVERS